MRTSEDNTSILIPTYKHIDSLHTEAFLQKYQPIIRDAQNVIFDLSQVDFVDSSGLGVLLELVRVIHSRGNKVAICCPKQSVEVLFRMVKLSKLVPIFSSQEEALGWMAT